VSLSSRSQGFNSDAPARNQSGVVLLDGNEGLTATFVNHGAPQQQRKSLMLRTLALSASVLAFAGGVALAETTLSTGQWLASDVYKASVYDPSDHKIGNVTNLVIDSNGNVTAAIISVSSGFLGVNQKDVVIPFKELKAASRDGKDWLVLNRTKDELMTAPAFNSTGAPSDYRNR
jgi:sporulation protein YlmC with PRC-barrel domain